MVNPLLSVISGFSSLLFLSGVILTAVGTFVSNSYFINGSIQGQQIIATGLGDTHLLSPFKWCDDYQGPQNVFGIVAIPVGNVCSNIDANCNFVYTQSGGIQTTLQLTNCTQFNAYRAFLIGVMIFSGLALIFALPSVCSEYAKAPRYIAAFLGFLDIICGVVAIGLLIGYEKNQFDPFINASPLLFILPPMPQASTLGNGGILQIVGSSCAILGGFLTFFAACGACAPKDSYDFLQEIQMNQMYTNFYTQNPLGTTPTASLGTSTTGSTTILTPEGQVQTVGNTAANTSYYDRL